MNIWIIKEGEPLPNDNNSRLLRVGLLSEYLAQKGHKVTWWTSSFNHVEKKYRTNKYIETDIAENEKLILLHSKHSYTRNTSIKRVRYHKILAKEFTKHTEHRETPDVILCCYPTVQFAQRAIKYGKKYDIPVILDVRDLWPDIFARIFPKNIRILAQIALLPLKFKAHKVFNQADAITGVVPSAVSWGLDKAGRKAGLNDECIYIAYDKKELDETQLELATKDWETIGITNRTWNICFFGTLSTNSMDFDTVIDAMEIIGTDYPFIKLILCGTGDEKERLLQRTAEMENIVLPGWMDQYQMESLMNISKMGLYPCRNTFDFKNAFGNKIIQYMSAGLPILLDLEGFSSEYVTQYNMGYVYKEGSVTSCVNRVIECYTNAEIRETKALNSRARFDIDFRADIVNAQFEKYLLKIANK